jgi:hypothetical protein
VSNLLLEVRWLNRKDSSCFQVTVLESGEDFITSGLVHK